MDFLPAELPGKPRLPIGVLNPFFFKFLTSYSVGNSSGQGNNSYLMQTGFHSYKMISMMMVYLEMDDDVYDRQAMY